MRTAPLRARLALGLGSVAWGLALAGCGAADGLDDGRGDAGAIADAPTWVGAVAGTDAVVGAVSDGASITFYLCGGPSSLATLTRWWRGDVNADGAYDLSAEDGAWTVRGRLGGAGEIHTEDGRTLAFEARAATGSVAGLYDALDGACLTGAVVGDLDGDGGTRAQGVWCDGEGAFEQVTPIRSPLEVTTAGLEVRVEGHVKSMTLARVRRP